MSLFRDLPPPSFPSIDAAIESDKAEVTLSQTSPIPKQSSLKKADGEPLEDEESTRKSERHVHFKTVEDVSGDEVSAAIQKIGKHIGDPAKEGKAASLALQLLQAGSVRAGNVDAFFGILQEAMAHRAAVRAGGGKELRDLFLATHEHNNVFSTEQQVQLSVWLLWTDVAQQLNTDDSYQFSRAAKQVQVAIQELPKATDEEDKAELAQVQPPSQQPTSTATPTIPIPYPSPSPSSTSGGRKRLHSPPPCPAPEDESDPSVLESDPFGLAALLPKESKREERLKRKREAEQEEGAMLRERREALVHCLHTATKLYKRKWAQTTIDMLVKFAFDHRERFTANQRQAVGRLWISVRDQRLERQQGKLGSKLDVTAFERLQSHYSREDISIRKAVGGGGGRSTMTWLG